MYITFPSRFDVYTFHFYGDLRSS